MSNLNSDHKSKENDVFKDSVCTCIDCRNHRAGLLRKLRGQIDLDMVSAKLDPMDTQFTDTREIPE